MIKNNIDTIMPGGGKDTTRLNMEKYIQLAADDEKIKSNTEDRILEILLDKYHKQREPGERLQQQSATVQFQYLFKI
jgi:hypothetical protein